MREGIIVSRTVYDNRADTGESLVGIEIDGKIFFVKQKDLKPSNRRNSPKFRLSKGATIHEVRHLPGGKEFVRIPDDIMAVVHPGSSK